MTYFFAERPTDPLAGQCRVPHAGPRVGLTAGRVLGKAVERNRIKRRMREAVRLNLALLTRDVDLVLHPRRTVLTAEFAGLQSEVSRIFATVEKAGKKDDGRNA
jgi:ribonuclease P protein component